MLPLECLINLAQINASHEGGGHGFRFGLVPLLIRINFRRQVRLDVGVPHFPVGQRFKLVDFQPYVACPAELAFGSLPSVGACEPK